MISSRYPAHTSQPSPISSDLKMARRYASLQPWHLRLVNGFWVLLPTSGRYLTPALLVIHTARAGLVALGEQHTCLSPRTRNTGDMQAIEVSAEVQNRTAEFGLVSMASSRPCHGKFKCLKRSGGSVQHHH